MAYLETKDLTVGYHGKPLIEDIALHVQRGKIVTLIGPNGSGKSTILKTIIGQLSKVSGTVFLDGKAMEARSRNEIARRMAILMTARMDPELMTCRDVVSSGRYPYTGRLGILQPEDQAIVERSLAQVGGMEFADRPFSAISDGQRQRILLARALCQEPEIIVLDEPTSFLDIRYKLELLMNQAGLTQGSRPVEQAAHGARKRPRRAALAPRARSGAAHFGHSHLRRGRPHRPHRHPGGDLHPRIYCKAVPDGAREV